MTDESTNAAPAQGAPVSAENYVLANDDRVSTGKSFDPRQELLAKSPIPGVIILVHGVNSTGEWYEQTEAGLCQGLMERLGWVEGAAASSTLAAVRYKPEVQPDGRLDQSLSTKSYIDESSEARSPVIRFRWGFKAAAKDGTNEQDNAEYWQERIFLDEFDAWGGGPFQNGTATLADMWGLGLNDRAFWWIYTNMLPVEGREIYASPPRAYFAHAAHRLKELIKAIRKAQPDCPITVVCHSQGNMVSLGAAFLGSNDKESGGKAIADTYVMCNPPYSTGINFMDKVVNRSQRSHAGKKGAVTPEARVATLKNFIALVEARAAVEQKREEINAWLGLKDKESGKPLWELGAFWVDPPEDPSKDRDNRGKIFLYCNPHDQVISASPVQGIGWKGLDLATLKKVDATVMPEGAKEPSPAGTMFQRVWAQARRDGKPLQVGDKAWGRTYRYHEDNHDPKKFWVPEPEHVKYSLDFNPSQTLPSRMVSWLASPLFYVITRAMGGISASAMPDKGYAVPVSAPYLRKPVMPQSVRYGTVGDFDQGKDGSRDALNAANPETGTLYGGQGKGDAQSQGELIYEHNARVRMHRAQGDIKTDEDEHKDRQRMINENPNATDHSTILTNAEHARCVLAYDVAVGNCWLSPEDWVRFRKIAHWRFIPDKLEQEPNNFFSYYAEGKYEVPTEPDKKKSKKSLHEYYDIEHMRTYADGIKDEREGPPLGFLY